MSNDGQVIQQDVSSGGVAGRLFRPSAGHVRGGVIVLGGSGGGIGWSGEVAEQLAADGYAALALAYFRWPGLSKHLVEIPLEYVEGALRWMRDDAVAGGTGRPVALVGASRGAELALLAASTFPTVGAVVAIAPSSVRWGPVGGIGTIGRSAWTFRGRALPGMPVRAPWRWPAAGARALSSWVLGTPLRGTASFLEALRDPDAVARAAIPVEKIRGPVLLVSGGDDQMWPSARMGEDIRSRLAAARHPFEVRHLCYEGAGHAVSILRADAYPTTARHRITRMVYHLGGSESANAKASESAGAEALEFLRRHLEG